MLLLHLISMALLCSLVSGWKGLAPVLDRGGWIWLALAGASNYLIGLFFYFKSIPRLGASRAASIANANPGLSVVLAVIFLREGGSPILWLGVLLILAGAYLVGKG